LALYEKLNAPSVVMTPESAEIAKYASNAFLATKLSFVNAVATLCEQTGGEIDDVTRAMGLDPRIGPQFLNPGPGWGGSCFPKDTSALVRTAEAVGIDFRLLREVIETNNDQFERITRRIIELAQGSVEGHIVAMWGITFKAGTDDLRDSPAMQIASRLIGEGAQLQVYDPTFRADRHGLKASPDPYSACIGASVLVVATEWNEFRDVDLHRAGDLMARRSIVDARNILSPVKAREAGFRYACIGSGVGSS
jgi:UDPglucose 6-dehydrogenase